MEEIEEFQKSIKELAKTGKDVCDEKCRKCKYLNTCIPRMRTAIGILAETLDELTEKILDLAKSLQHEKPLDRGEIYFS